MKSLVLALLLLSTAYATENDLRHRPKSFAVSGGHAVFADFTEANYEITYDMLNKTAYVKADINFVTSETGFPIFDSVVMPTVTMLDGHPVQQVEVKTPQK
jgi:hypothetical protein